MRGPLLIVASIGLTVLSWGLYGPTLHTGQEKMSTIGEYARLRPLMGVGMAYFGIAVIVPSVLLSLRGEKGHWSSKGIATSLFAGSLGAVGALGIILAFTFGGKPSWVMPLVFGGAPVVNAFITIYLAKKLNEIGPVFLAGLLMVVMGAVTVLVCKPPPAKHAHAAETVAAADVEAGSVDAGTETADENDSKGTAAAKSAPVQASLFNPLPILATCLVMACWGSYGPVLHKGQAAMGQSKLRPLLCVGLAYFVIAVATPWLLLNGPVTEASTFNFSGTAWSMAGGTLGAFGALGIIMAFTFGGKPVYVMPLVFGGAPVVTTIHALFIGGGIDRMSSMRLGGFLAGLMLVVAGAAIVLIFAPKGAPPKPAKSAPKADPPAPKTDKPDEPAGLVSPS